MPNSNEWNKSNYSYTSKLISLNSTDNASPRFYFSNISYTNMRNIPCKAL